MPKLQGLIFDLDGTLIDSAPDLRNALNKTLVELGRRAITLDEIKGFLGDGMLTMMQRAFAVTGATLADDESYRILQHFLVHYRTQKADPSMIYPHVLEVLDSFSKEGVKLAVCTNKQEAATLRLLEELNLAHYFAFVAGGDTFMVHKPHPGHVLGVIEKLAVPTTNCVMVGDSINDVLAAHGAGIPCLVVTQGYAADTNSLGANGLMDSMRDLREAIKKLGTYELL